MMRIIKASLRLILRRKRLVTMIVCIVICLYLIHVLMNLSSQESSHLICETTPEMRGAMSIMLSDIQSTLESLSITYFLCYNSLWGALKVKSPLKWDTNLDICLLNEEISKLDEAFLIRTFKRKDLQLSYRSSDGVYLVTQGHIALPSAKLFIFEEDEAMNQYRRVGWKNRLMPIDSCGDTLHCFPPSLITKPLPLEKFMDIEMPIPREEIEILKYLFPDTWWKSLKPKHCIDDDE